MQAWGTIGTYEAREEANPIPQNPSPPNDACNEGGLLATVIHNGPDAGVYFPFYDGNGNVMGYVRGADGLLVAQYEYGPFGELLRATGPLPQSFNPLFSTKYHDWETGLLYYGYRYYNPTTGRWPNRDPLRELGFEVLRGKPQIEDKRQRQTRRKATAPNETSNLYVFVGNDPLARIDPFGLDWSTTGKAIWTALGYIVPGGEFPTAAMSAPDCAKILILSKFKAACAKCMYDPPDSDPDCKICDDYEKVKAKLSK